MRLRTILNSIQKYRGFVCAGVLMSEAPMMPRIELVPPWGLPVFFAYAIRRVDRRRCELLNRWCARTMRSKIEPTKKVARMVRRHHDLLLNWFRARGQIWAGAVRV